MAQPRQVTQGPTGPRSYQPPNPYQAYLTQQPALGASSSSPLSLAQTAAPTVNPLTNLPTGGNPLPGAPQAPTPGAGGTAPASTIVSNPGGGHANTGLISSIPQTFDTTFDGSFVQSPGAYPVNQLSGSWVASQQPYLDAIKGGRPWDPDPLPATQEDRLIWAYANNGRTPTAGQDWRGYFTTTDGRGPNGEFGFFTDDSGVKAGLSAGTSYQGASGADLLAAMDRDPGLKALIAEGLRDPKALAAELADEYSPLGQHFNRPAIFDAVELASQTMGDHPGERPDWWGNPNIYTPQHVMEENYQMANRDGTFTHLTPEEHAAAVAALQRNGARGMRHGPDPTPLGQNVARAGAPTDITFDLGENERADKGGKGGKGKGNNGVGDGVGGGRTGNRGKHLGQVDAEGMGGGGGGRHADRATGFVDYVTNPATGQVTAVPASSGGGSSSGGRSHDERQANQEKRDDRHDRKDDRKR